MERHSISCVIRELQMRTMRYHYVPIRMDKSITLTTKWWWKCRATETVICCWWEGKMVQSLWKTVWQFPTKLNIWSSNYAPWYLKKLIKKPMSMQKSVQQCSSWFIHNSQKAETTQMSINWGMDKSNVACLTEEY